MSSSYVAALFPGPRTSNILSRSQAWKQSTWHCQTLREKPLHASSSSMSYAYPPVKNQLHYCPTANPRLISLRILLDTDKQSISIYDIMQFDTTYTISRLKWTTFPQNINQQTCLPRRSGPQSMHALPAQSVYATATKRRFFSEYAAQAESLT